MASLIRIFLVSATVLFIAGATAPTANAQFVIHINGTVPCGTGLVSSSGNLLRFPNAMVQVKCGNNVIASTTANSKGEFGIVMNAVNGLIPSLLNNCKLQVPTPLTVCNPSASADGVLQSPLTLITGIISGILNGIIGLIPSGFSLLHA